MTGARTAALAGCLALTACVSVPLSTMVRMSSFDERDFVALDPDVLRVRIRLPEAFVLDPSRSALAVDITADAGVHHGEFTLDAEATEKVQLSAGVFSGDVAGTAYTLKLSAESRKAFRRLQAFVERGPPSQVTIRIIPILSAFPADANSVNVWIDLQLWPGQGYFPLVDAGEVPMDRIREASTARGS